MNSNYVAVFLKKTVLNKTVNVMQIALVFWRQERLQFFVRHLKNDLKNANHQVEISEVIFKVDELLQNKKIILKNDDDLDFYYLNQMYLKHLNKPFDFEIIDVTKNAKYLGHKKTSLKYLSNYYQVHFENDQKLPISVHKARYIFAITNKMLNL